MAGLFFWRRQYIRWKWEMIEKHVRLLGIYAERFSTEIVKVAEEVDRTRPGDAVVINQSGEAEPYRPT